MNDFFATTISNINIRGYEFTSYPHLSLHRISNIIASFENHPTIVKLKTWYRRAVSFSFSLINDTIIYHEISSLDISKPTTFNNIPSKFLACPNDICSSYLSNLFNSTIVESIFSSELKMVEISPAHKEDKKTKKDNYIPVSILISISKIFERIMYDQIEI